MLTAKITFITEGEVSEEKIQELGTILSENLPNIEGLPELSAVVVGIENPTVASDDVEGDVNPAGAEAL